MPSSENNKLMYWALNALWTILLSIAFMWVSSLSSQMEAIKQVISLTETKVAADQTNIEAIQKWLERIESKLDRILYKQ